VFWVPRDTAFADLVERGTLSGQVSEKSFGKDVLLENLTEKQLKLIESEDSVLSFDVHEPKLPLFYWEGPLVSVRVARGG